MQDKSMETKTCTKCGLEKDIDEFSFKNKSSGRRQSSCKSCDNIYTKNHYNDNKEYYVEKAKKATQQKKEWIIDYKKSCVCNKCGESRWYLLDFHHSDRSIKDFGIAKKYKSVAFSLLKEEISKCIVLCSNCHRELHYFENQLENDDSSDIL